MNKKTLLQMAAAFCFPVALISCSSDSDVATTDDGTTGLEKEKVKTEDDGRIIVAATVDGVNYLVPTSSLDEGTISVKGKGLETESGSYWVFKNDKYLFRLVYRQGDPGAGSSYVLNNNMSVLENLTYNFNRITTYGSWGSNVITASAGDTDQKDAEGNIAQGLLFNYLNDQNGTVKTETHVAENFLGNGEYVSFAGFVEANNRLYTSVIPMGMSQYGVKNFPNMVTDTELITKASGGSKSSSYDKGEIPMTQYPDSAFVAIYSGDNFNEKPVIARTGKIGYACGRMRSQYYQTIWSNDEGDLYVFSPGYGRYSVYDEDTKNNIKKVKGSLPSGVVRIKKGATTFDDSYYVNIETATGGLPMYRCWHMTGNYYLLQLYSSVESINRLATGTTKLAVFNASTGKATIVTGLPEESTITSFGTNPYTHNGFTYMPVTTNAQGSYPAFYRINPATAVATKGATVEAESISAAGWLKKH